MRPLIFVMQGLLFTQNNEFEKALDSFAKTLELDATFMHNTELHSYKGRCFMELKMYKEAADSMTIAVQLEPHNIGFLNCLNKAKVLLNYLSFLIFF